MSKSYSLSKISLAIALSVAGQAAFAEITSADANTQISKKQGIEIINIANPSAAGLSHNRYDKFNVDKAGAVLNNARQNGKSQLAGDLNANPNLKTQSAKVILNEVVSRNPSKIAGQQEVFGDKADYVLANPNGISVQGGGFINTPRASLVVGKPQVAEGKLKGYDTTGDNALSTSGKITSSGDIDLIAPQVTVGGQITTKDGVNIITGKNKIAREDNGTLKITTTERKGQVLDGKVVGSIQAGRIRIHSTDDRATITAQAADLQAKEVDITAGNANLNGRISRHTDRGKAKITNQNGVQAREHQSGSSETYQATRIQAEQFDMNISGNLNIVGTDIQARNSNIRGGNVHLGAEKTVNLREHSKNQSKGSWYRNEQESNRVETTHRTTIAGDSVNIEATKGKVTTGGAKVSAKTTAIYGEQGVNLRGVKATTTQTARAEFKNETARLKTGLSSQDSSVQHYTATELTTEQDLILGGKGDVHLTGVVANVDGALLAKNSGALSFASEKSTESYNLSDDMRFWGGLAGSKTVGTGRSAETVHGADFTVKGDATLDASHGVYISGSRVVTGGNGVVKGNAGALVIDSTQAKTTAVDYARQGTIFDITKARQSSYTHTSTAKGSTLKSESNLQLSTSKNVSIAGSTVQSAGLLDIAAKSGIEVKGAANHVRTESSKAGFSFAGGFDSLKTSFQHGHLTANLNIDNSKGTPSVDSDIEISKEKKADAVNAEGKFHLGLNVYNNSQNSHTTTHTGSSVKGNDVALNAKTVTVSGSEVAATHGNLVINADKITTQAAQNQSINNSVKNEVNVGLSGTITESKLSGTLGVSVAHALTSSVENKAQASKLSASNDVKLNANRIEHQGSQVQAGGNIQENAKEVLHTTAKNSTNSFGNNVNVDLSVSAGINQAKAFNVNAELSAKGGHETASSTTHTATQLQASKNISVNANHIQDNATQYKAGETAQFTSQSHQLNAVANRVEKNSLSAGASVGVSANTSDFQRFNVAAKVGANYNQSSSQESNAVQGSINAKNVNIHTGKFNSQANINASENVNIQAQSAQFSQATSSKTQSGGGFEAKVGVGAMVVPSAGAAVPSIDLSLSANGKNGNQSQAVTNTIAGKNVNVQTQGVLNLQGTNVQAVENAQLSGNRVNITAGNNAVQSVAATVATGVNIGAKVANAGFNANVGVNTENSQTHTGVAVNGKNVSIQAQNGVNLKGVTSTSEQLNLNAGKGNLALTAATDSVNKTDVSVGLKLVGGVAEQKWTPSSGSGHLAVNVVRNETHTETTLNTDTAKINAGGDAKFIGGSVNANHASGTISGDSHSEQLANKVNEVSVSLSANGSGKLAVPAADKWAEAAKNDWNNGTIAGVKADAKVEVNAKHQQSATNAGVNAKHDATVVKGSKTRIAMKNTHSRQVNVKLAPTTAIKKQVEAKIPEKVKTAAKPVRAVNLQLVHNNKVDFKVRVKR